MIDQKKLKELVKLMVENELTEIDIQDESERVALKRGAVTAPTPVTTVAPSTPALEGPGPSADDGLVPVASPMVGTFYSASSPDADPFINVGDRVEADSVICIIEAMKVFNEIKAEVSGVVERVLVQNGQAVEFGQDLFLVQPQ